MGNYPARSIYFTQSGSEVKKAADTGVVAAQEEIERRVKKKANKKKSTKL